MYIQREKKTMTFNFDWYISYYSLNMRDFFPDFALQYSDFLKSVIFFQNYILWYIFGLVFSSFPQLQFVTHIKYYFAEWKIKLSFFVMEK